MAKLPRPTGKQMLHFLVRQGFALVNIEGSHHVLKRDQLRTTVPVHGNNNLKTGTLHKILRDVELSPPDFERLFRR